MIKEFIPTVGEQVTSIKQSEELSKLGLDYSTASMSWSVFRDEEMGTTDYTLDLIPYRYNRHRLMGAWTVYDLLHMLPSHIKRNGKTMFLKVDVAGSYCWNVYYQSPDRLDEFWKTDENLLTAVVEMVISHLKNEI